MKPTIGRIVHYVNLGDADGKFPPEIQAAIITGINVYDYPEGTRAANSLTATYDTSLVSSVDLTVFYRTGYFQATCVPFSETYKRGHWSWPPKTEGANK